MPLVSVYIIAFNEAEKVRATIESAHWADEIILVDSHSTDGTQDIAAAMGARVVQVEFKGFGDLRNQAIAACTQVCRVISSYTCYGLGSGKVRQV